MSGPYDDIIHLPHHVSATHPQMPLENRAAQFSPFAALTGYDAAIKETARRTDRRVELGESELADLNMKLCMLADRIADRPEVELTYFKRDEKKEGGAYIAATGTVKHIDAHAGAVVFADGRTIAIADILNIESEIFGALL